MPFSCIVTCYNRQNIIGTSIQSILNQTYQNFEIIVVDDCSTDQSIEEIEKIDDPRIKLIKHKLNKGQNAALNTGVKNSNQQIVAFLDSDDVWDENYLSEMNATYFKFPTIGFCYSNLFNGPFWKLEGENRYADVLNQGYLSSMITITAKKSAIKEIGGFDEKYSICQDDDFCFRLAQKFSFKVIEKPLARIIGAENSMTRNLNQVAGGWLFLFENYKKDILDLCGSKTYSKHMLSVSRLFFESNNLIKGSQYYLIALIYLLTPSNHHYQFSPRSFFKESINIFKMIGKKLQNRIKFP